MKGFGTRCNSEEIMYLGVSYNCFSRICVLFLKIMYRITRILYNWPELTNYKTTSQRGVTFGISSPLWRRGWREKVASGRNSGAGRVYLSAMWWRQCWTSPGGGLYCPGGSYHSKSKVSRSWWTLKSFSKKSRSEDREDSKPHSFSCHFINKVLTIINQ